MSSQLLPSLWCTAKDWRYDKIPTIPTTTTPNTAAAATKTVDGLVAAAAAAAAATAQVNDNGNERCEGSIAHCTENTNAGG